MLDQAPRFDYSNYSVPNYDPLHEKTKGELTAALGRQINPTNIVLVLGGMYVAYSSWIQKEIDIAKEKDKPIIGIYPWGSSRMPEAVQDAADVMVGWRTSSIITAIRNHSI